MYLFDSIIFKLVPFLNWYCFIIAIFMAQEAIKILNDENTVFPKNNSHSRAKLSTQQISTQVIRKNIENTYDEMT
jgi:hypothetical protein